MAAAAEKRGREVNRADLAGILGVSLVTVDAYVRRGCPFVRRGAKGREWAFDSAAVVEWLRQQDVEAALGDTSKLDADEARRRKLAAEAALAEYELAKVRREVVAVDEVAAVVTDELANVRSRLLAIPGRLSHAVAAEADPAKCEALLKAEVSDALMELSADGGRDEDGA